MRKLLALIHFLAWGCLLVLTASLWGDFRRNQEARQEGSNLSVVRDCAYRTGAGHPPKLDVYAPPGSQGTSGKTLRLPAVLAIHGGSWSGGSKSEYGPQVSRLARHGYVVFVADYRL